MLRDGLVRDAEAYQWKLSGVNLGSTSKVQKAHEFDRVAGSRLRGSRARGCHVRGAAAWLSHGEWLVRNASR